MGVLKPSRCRRRTLTDGENGPESNDAAKKDGATFSMESTQSVAIFICTEKASQLARTA